MRPSRDTWAMALAQETAKRATCLRRAVGCILLNSRGHVLATGYNGVATGMDHCNQAESEGHVVEVFPHACPGHDKPSGQGLDSCHAVHAEQNALLQCRDVHTIHTCYTTTSPCVTCTKLLMNTSCERIVFLEDYQHGISRDLWVNTQHRTWEKLQVTLTPVMVGQ